MSIIEGIGDEILVFAAVVGFVGAILIAWTSTRVRPLFNSSSVWMVHMQTAPERRVLEVYSLDDSSSLRSQLSVATAGMDDPSANSSNTNEESPAGNQQQPMANSSGDETDHSTNGSQPDEREDGGEDQSGQSVAESPTESTPSTNDTTAEETVAPEPAASSNASTATIKLKFLDDTQKLVAAWLSQTVGEFKRQHFETDMSEGRVVRLIYRGQLLRDDSRSLASYGLHENCVVHCHVGVTPYDQSTSAGHSRAVRSHQNQAGRSDGERNQAAPNGLDLGRYVYFIFAFKFMALWSAWFVFPEYFSRTSFLSLILCSGLFMIFWYGSQRHRPIAEPSGNRNPSS